MPYKYASKHPPVEGYCAECGSVKVTYYRYRWIKRTFPGGQIPCSDRWHWFARTLDRRIMLHLMKRRVERLTADELTRLGEELGGD